MIEYRHFCCRKGGMNDFDCCKVKGKLGETAGTLSKDSRMEAEGKDEKKPIKFKERSASHQRKARAADTACAAGLSAKKAIHNGNN